MMGCGLVHIVHRLILQQKTDAAFSSVANFDFLNKK
jgi:hypothetical protein